ncbi:hypothetical protein LQ757_18650 [Agromyces sp. SYSU K20354]|uniref:hypothetical protein n=1 Tax=Agromyces cavernae TaxID=2898659 RepID=UPI001E4987F8|nr:hypothetical protein [Agromyces cavernae]MCD2444306.1 hypothetical protein [Agromyces cavernae]
MDVIGGGILVAVAAALWIAYLLPSWLGRRQYLATERNAVRLQQTLRILAETAETPEPVRIEATAREVVSQQRILHEHQEAARLAAEAAEQLAIAERREAEDAADAARSRAAAALAAHAPVTEPIAVVADAGSGAGHDSALNAASALDAAPSFEAVRAARRSLRRKRAACSLTFLLALLTAVGGLIAAAFGATLVIAAIAGGVAVAAFAGIVALARVRMPSAPAVEPVEVAPESFEPIELSDDESAEGWTPQPLPRPLHLSRGTIAATAMASIEAAAELKRAEAAATVARRAERLAPDVPKLRPAASAPAPSAAEPAASEPANPYARMGIVDDARPALDDLDAVLRRRRAVG